MSSTGSLFLLIKTMSKNEKIQFKRFYSSKKSETKNYIRLFNFIDKMETEDDQFIKKKFAGEKFINQLSVAKNYLFHQILDSLNYSHQEDLSDVGISGSIAKAEILIRKALYKEAEKLLREVLGKCCDLEKYHYVPLVMHKLRRILLFDQRLDLGEELDQLKEKDAEVSERIENASSLEWNYLKLRELSIADIEPNKKRTIVRNVFDKLPGDFSGDYSFYEKYFLVHSKSLSGFVLDGNSGFDLEGYELLIDQFLRSPFLSVEEPLLFGNLLIAKLNNVNRSKDLNKINEVIELIKHQMSESNAGFSNLANRFYPAMLHTFLLIKDWNQGIKFLESNKDEFSKLHHFVSSETLLLVYGNASIIYYQGQKTNEALKLLHQISGLSTRRFIFFRNFLELFWMMIQFEREEWDLIEYRVNLIGKKIQRSKDLIGYESGFVRMMRSVARNPERLNIIANLQEIQALVFSLSADPTMLTLNETFNVSEWTKRAMSKYRKS